MQPGKQVFRPVVLTSVTTPAAAGGFRFSAWVATGFVAPMLHPDGRRMIAEHDYMRPDDGTWVDSLAEAKERLARDIEDKAAGLLAQASAIKVEAALDRAREAESTDATEAA